MTIESPAKFLQGGAECLPPGENLVSSPVPSSPPATGDSSNASVDEKGVRRTPKRKRYKAWGTKVSKKGSKGKPQTKNLPGGADTSNVQGELPKDISSPMVIGDGVSSGEELRTKTAVVSPTEKTVDLKKSPKTKCTCDASREEAASRKSLRLKLKNGRSDFSNGNNDVRPRDFETLVEIDFNDQNHRTMFMDALGLSSQSKKSTTVEEKTAEKVVCICNFGTMSKGPAQEKSAIELTGLHGTDGTRPPPSHWTVQACEMKTSKKAGESQQDVRYQLRDSSKPSCSKQLIYRDHSESEDNDGWERWVNKLPVAQWSAKTESPSCSEISDSVKRLINLGTEIKLITPNM